MRLHANDKALLVLVLVLAIVSLALKASLGPTLVAPSSSGPSSFQTQLKNILSAQGFQTDVRVPKVGSPIVTARRGSCVLSVRDATGGVSGQVAFSHDAREIGPVRYLYSGD